jgi:hypothetical protein
VSPILVRPVREQLEHDRVIRLLYARAKRRFQVGMNPGAELNAPVGAGEDALYPDVVLASLERGHRLKAVVEVETGESVNNLEALSEWARMARLRAAFHLYVPAGSVEAARRLCSDHAIAVQEIWSYHLVGDQMRFTMAYRAPVASRTARKRPAKAAKRPAASAARKAAARRPAAAAKRPRPKSGKAAAKGSRAQKRKK